MASRTSLLLGKIVKFSASGCTGIGRVVGTEKDGTNCIVYIIKRIYTSTFGHSPGYDITFPFFSSYQYNLDHHYIFSEKELKSNFWNVHADNCNPIPFEEDL